MAGKGQHYIPRFLLNGFASRSQGKDSFVWNFRKGIPPFEQNTKKIGKENKFYGEPDGPLDKFITDGLETQQSKCLESVRANRAITSPADRDILICFLDSLVVRPKNLRVTMEKGVHKVLDETQQIFTDLNAARRWVLNLEKTDKPRWDEMLTRYVRVKYDVQNSRRENYLKWQKRLEFKQWLLRNPMAAEGFREEMIAPIKAAHRQMDEMVEELVKNSHNESLEKGLKADFDADNPRHSRYLQMHWKVQSFDDGSLILGDVVVIQFDRRTRIFSSVFYADSEGDVILLPLSHNLLLIGTLEDEPLFISPHEINRHSAALSIDFFVASRNSEQENEYHTVLGSRALQFTKAFEDLP